MKQRGVLQFDAKVPDEVYEYFTVYDLRKAHIVVADTTYMTYITMVPLYYQTAFVVPVVYVLSTCRAPVFKLFPLFELVSVFWIRTSMSCSSDRRRCV